MLITVDEHTLDQAAYIHSVAWKESHLPFCSAAFVEAHTVERQKKYLQSERAAGKHLFMLIAEQAVGIVSVSGGLIENLYVLPSEHGKGYGSQLLAHALSQCVQTPVLWVLSNNERALHFYQKHGFIETGKRKILSDSLAEIEMTFPTA